MKTEVVNIYKIDKNWINDPQFVYIGRPGKGQTGYFGNPFPLVAGEPRGSTIDKFKTYALDRVKNDPEYREQVKALKGKTLVCFCKPNACHGDILAEIAESL